MGSLVADLREQLAAEVRETHISWAFLGRDRVYKVKKPVDLGFLDYRGIDRRKAFCEAEVALNRRLAPAVYLGVVPVRRGGSGRHRVGLGDGEIVDWAVEMVRLPDAARADVLLAGERLDVAAIDRIAARLVQFHATCETDERIASFGLPEAVALNVRENFEQTRATVLAHLGEVEAEEIERQQLAFLRDRGAVLRERAAAGRVRDGHGDLRLEHVYLEAEGPGSLTVLDCIEFNERFRFADVAADLAFLSMDLASHGRVDLAERLIARYALESNDYELYRVIDFYEGYRAYVRAKIAALSGLDDARRHFLLALAATRPPLIPPMIVAVGGALACGKTTIADLISRRTGAPVIEADRTRKHLLGVSAMTSVAGPGVWTGAYDPSVTDRVYTEMVRRAGEVLGSGRPVIVDASFRARSHRTELAELALRSGVPFRFVEVRADRDTCLARLRARRPGTTASDARVEIYDDFVSRMEPVNELSAVEHVILDTRPPLDAVERDLASRLGPWPMRGGNERAA